MLWFRAASTVSIAAAVGNTCTFENATDLNGHDLHAIESVSPEECCGACAEASSEGCRFWTFMPPSTCYMKVSDVGRRHAGDAGAPSVIAAYTSGSLSGTPTPPPAPAFSCQDDWDCSLAGTCREGACSCDDWASGADCSYLNFKPVDKAAIGYVDPSHSSWGGNAVSGSDGKWHLYMAEIACNSEDTGTRCGLGGWQSHSQVAHAVSQFPEGPYLRKELTLPQEHHNPTLQVSPIDGAWHLYSISRGSGPIVLSSSADEGKSWSDPSPGVQVSDKQNPGPILLEDGSMTMFYREDGTNLPEPTCSQESIGVQYCKNHAATCGDGRNPVFNHTAEDPSIFVDRRGNWHMLVNALPGQCKPKLQQGGHAWSRDGIVWSEPRVGAFNTTVLFTDGTSMQCNRRERPQMVLDEHKVPLVMFSGTTGCPAMEGTSYKGGSDCFTLAQLMNRPAAQSLEVVV